VKVHIFTSDSYIEINSQTYPLLFLVDEYYSCTENAPVKKELEERICVQRG
jgi:hypothetical protein